MSNLWLNVRFFSWHLQWAGGERWPSISRNDYWIGRWRPFFAVYALWPLLAKDREMWRS